MDKDNVSRSAPKNALTQNESEELNSWRDETKWA